MTSIIYIRYIYILEVIIKIISISWDTVSGPCVHLCTVLCVYIYINVSVQCVCTYMEMFCVAAYVSCVFRLSYSMTFSNGICFIHACFCFTVIPSCPCHVAGSQPAVTSRWGPRASVGDKAIAITCCLVKFVLYYVHSVMHTNI